MKKYSNQKSQFLKKYTQVLKADQVSLIKIMDLNVFKKLSEIHDQSNESLFDLVNNKINTSNKQTMTQTATTNQDDTATSKQDDTATSQQDDTATSQQDPDDQVSTFADLFADQDDTATSQQDPDDQDDTATIPKYGSSNNQDINDLAKKNIQKAIDQGIQIIEPDYRALLNATNEKYMQRGNEFKNIDMAFEMNYKKGLLFAGGSGIGKTLMGLYYSTIRKYPCVFMSCHSGITKDELIGSYQLVNGSSAYVLGEIIQAIICANASPTKRSLLLLDEINCLESSTMKILNEMLRFKDGIVIPELGIKYKLNEGCQVLVFCTANPLSYSGTNELNPELESRLEIIKLNDLSSDELKDLVNDGYKIDSTLLDNLIRLKELIDESNRESKLDKGFDTREFIKMIDHYSVKRKNNIDHDQAISSALFNCLYGKFTLSDDPDQMVFVNETVESCLGFNVKDYNFFN